MLWFIAWAASLVGMVYVDLMTGAIGGLVGGIVLWLLKSLVHSQKKTKLERLYNEMYGDHPGYDDRAQRYGAAAGAVLGGGLESGGYLAGSVVGAGLDYLRDRKRKKDMPAEQVALYEELKAAYAYRPFAMFFFYVMWVLLGAGGVYFVELVLR